jgi:hypothetical protein
MDAAKAEILILMVTYRDREAVSSASDEALMQHFTVALDFPHCSFIGLYVVSWMISEIQTRELDPRRVESSPAW